MINKSRDNHSTTLTADALTDTKGGCHDDRSPPPPPAQPARGAVRTNFTVQQKLAGNSPFYTDGQKLYYRGRMGYRALVPFQDDNPWLVNTRNS